MNSPIYRNSAQVDPMPDVTRARHGGNAASVDAHESILPYAKNIREAVYLALSESPRGATCKELSRQLGVGYTTASARLSELKRDGFAFGTGQRRQGAEVLIASAVVLGGRQ